MKLYKARIVEVPDHLREQAAGISTFTMKRLGAGRAGKVQHAGIVAAFRQLDEIGDRGERMLTEAEAKREKGELQTDPEKKALAAFPALKVIEYCLIEMDGQGVTREAVIEWLDDAPDELVRWLALDHLRACGRVKETADERKNGSGDSSTA